MRLTVQKRLAAQIFNRSPKKIWIDPSRLDDVKESITKADIRALIIDNAITAESVRSNSRGRMRQRLKQRRKGRQGGKGSRKGRAAARLNTKQVWVAKIRCLRGLLKSLKSQKKLDSKCFRELYLKAKGGFFRNREHMKLYITEKGYVHKINKMK